METSELLKIIGCMPDPVLAGVAAVHAAETSNQRYEILEALLTQHATRLIPRDMRELTRLGRDLAAAEPANARQLCVRLSTDGPLARWLVAAILESEGQYASAASALGAIPDSDWDESRAIWLVALARNLASDRRWTEAWFHLREAIRCSEARQTLVQADQLLSRARNADIAIPARARKRVALIGSGSLSFWVPVLRPVIFAAGIDIDLFTGEFGQHRQEVLDSSSALANFRPEVVILATDWRSLGLSLEVAEADSVVCGHVTELRTLWRHCAETWGAAVIQHNFEIPEVDPFGHLSAELPGGRARILRRLNLALSDAAAADNIAVLDVDQVASLFSKRHWHDPIAWATSKQYPAPAALPLLARHEAAILRALAGLTSKCLVLDLDGTLWGGVIGEDGLTGIRLGGSPEGEAWVSFQHFVRGLSKRGILLAVCSKNNPEDALEPFRSHPEMVLKRDDFAAFVANWQSKSENLRHIAAELNLGLDSLVFVDDHPVERAQVRADLPEVEVPEMPRDPALYDVAISRSLFFEGVSLTADDRARVDTYRGNEERAQLFAATGNLEDFLRNLQMRLELRPFDLVNLPRIVQLINKTNQFNLTTRRMSAAMANQMVGDPLWYTQFVRVRDRFGDNGITGVLTARREGNAWRVDNWLLSCRVLGRRIEEVMLTALFGFATASGAAEVIGEYLPTAKNGQVANLYERLDFVRVRENEAGEALFVRRLDGTGLDFPQWAKVIDATAVISADET